MFRCSLSTSHPSLLLASFISSINSCMTGMENAAYMAACSGHQHAISIGTPASITSIPPVSPSSTASLSLSLHPLSLSHTSLTSLCRSRSIKEETRRRHGKCPTAYQRECNLMLDCIGVQQHAYLQVINQVIVLMVGKVERERVMDMISLLISNLRRKEFTFSYFSMAF